MNIDQTDRLPFVEWLHAYNPDDKIRDWMTFGKTPKVFEFFWKNNNARCTHTNKWADTYQDVFLAMGETLSE